MRVTVIGATGNVGSALVRALVADPDVDEIIGVARRRPGPSWLALDKTSWVAADIAHDPVDVIAGSDAVVHLAWMIQPSRDEARMRRTNLDGTRRVIKAVIDHRVPKLVYASSVGAYGRGPKRPPVDESWPTNGIASSTYSRHKAEVESMLDGVCAEQPAVSIVRMRTSLVVQRSAASQIHRLFLGRLAPWHLPRALRLLPRHPQLVAQVTHADDIAAAYVRAIHAPVRGPFNVAARQPLDGAGLAAAVAGRSVPVPARALRSAAALSYHARLQPTEPGWLDLAAGAPVMDTTRAERTLGWRARRSAADAVAELARGIGDGAGDDTEPLQPRRR